MSLFQPHFIWHNMSGSLFFLYYQTLLEASRVMKEETSRPYGFFVILKIMQDNNVMGSGKEDLRTSTNHPT